MPRTLEFRVTVQLEHTPFFSLIPSMIIVNGVREAPIGLKQTDMDMNLLAVISVRLDNTIRLKQQLFA